MKPAFLLLMCFVAWPLLGQVNTGELRVKVTDANGLGLQVAISVVSEANQYSNELGTNEEGMVRFKTLAYGVYRLKIEKPGFSTTENSVEIRSAIPVDRTFQLALAPVSTVIQVSSTGTLIDPSRPSSIVQIGTIQIEDRVASLPGRSVQDLVNSQPGWLYEGNAVLHPRGSEYQTQLVVDGVPLTDNRSPGFGPEIEADDLDSVSIYTAGFPAEYGRKLGGVVELNTKRQAQAGLHGQLVLGGGSYDTLQSFGEVQKTWSKDSLFASGSGSSTSHYLNPVVPENFTNKGTTGDFAVRYERDFTASDRLTLSVRHELSRFEIPNELLQQQAGQIQNGDNFETIGSASYQHIFSPNLLTNIVGMVRDNANDLYSNPLSTPIVAFQKNSFREGYFKGTVSLHHGNQEFKAGVESDTTFLHENFSYTITDPTQFDDGTPVTLPPFVQSRPDLEQSAFVEDLIRLGRWTVSAGLRWDHYQLLLNQNAFSPRVSVGRYLPSLNTVFHVSYDRIFQTPSNENILISSSGYIQSVNPEVLKLPVKPSEGNYYEGGLSKSFGERLRLDINLYRRDVRNYADDDQLLNTGVSYPIAFDKSVIYGAEGKLDLVHLGKLTGYVSYSYMVGNVWFPVTGGLFLGDDANAALTQLSGHFPDSQDQRNTVRTRFKYQLLSRVWLAAGLLSGSGLPFEYEGSQEDALAQYGPSVVNRLNFDRGRVDPALSVQASLGADVFKSERINSRLQVDGDNLNNRLNVIDFGGLFSGNAIGPARSFTIRLNTSF
ncbi:TonB-dependent receptor [Granulicella sp. S190]|uniref:TonB-dependent receptor n=1 Tax=Granulicella sp. S190 TaxID=1747226 RepID=UPI00131C880F|nr:TonB-dependent receptor [Granulicella sp. S190]